MLPLASGTVIDFYLVARLILRNSTLSMLAAMVLASIFAGLWVILPRICREDSKNHALTSD